MKKILTLLVLSLMTLTASAVNLKAITTSGETLYINLYDMSYSDTFESGNDFEIVGDIEDRFAIVLDGEYLSYSIYEDGNGHETIYFDLSDDPVYWRFDSEKGLIYSDDFFVESDGEYIYYISLTYNAIHGYYMNLKKSTYLPINVAKFEFIYEDRIIVNKPYESGLESLKNDISESSLIKYDLNGRIIKDFDSFKGVYVSGGKNFLKK